MRRLTLRPCDIRYSQDSINNTFGNSGRKIGEVLDDIYYGRLNIEALPTISVILVSGACVSLDNRRLWIFKQLERLKKCPNITVNVEHEIPLLCMNAWRDGTNVTVRGHPGGTLSNDHTFWGQLGLFFGFGTLSVDAVGRIAFSAGGFVAILIMSLFTVQQDIARQRDYVLLQQLLQRHATR